MEDTFSSLGLDNVYTLRSACSTSWSYVSFCSSTFFIGNIWKLSYTILALWESQKSDLTSKYSSQLCVTLLLWCHIHIPRNIEPMLVQAPGTKLMQSLTLESHNLSRDSIILFPMKLRQVCNCKAENHFSGSFSKVDSFPFVLLSDAPHVSAQRWVERFIYSFCSITEAWKFFFHPSCLCWDFIFWKFKS